MNHSELLPSTDVGDQATSLLPPPSTVTRLPGDAALVAVGFLAVSLTGCGPGGSTPTDDAAPSTVTNPTTVTPPATVTARPFARPTSESDAARFLAQATLGANKAEIVALQSSSFESWIDAQFAITPIVGYYDWLSGPQGAVVQSGAAGDHSQVNNIWRKMIASPDALRQRIVQALAQIFVVYFTDGPGPFVTAAYLDRLEQSAFGTYRDLLQTVSLSLAMAETLTFLNSVKEDPVSGREPDENYARELMQLFTIGLYELNPDGSAKLDALGAPIPTYDTPDVRGLARVFTGWGIDRSPLPAGALLTDDVRRDLICKPNLHESGTKTFLNTTIPANTDGPTSLDLALDAVFAHSNVGPFIGKQLIQRLVTSNPSPAYVSRVSAAFNNNGDGQRGDMKAVVKAILLDQEARDPSVAARPTFGKLREPMVRLANAARGWNASSVGGWWGANHGYYTSSPTKLNQGPLQASSVFNFYRPTFSPAASQIAASGLVAPEFQITNEVSIAGYVNTMATFFNSGIQQDIKGDFSSLMAIADNSAALLDEINLVLAAGQVSAATLGTLKLAIDTISVASEAGKTNRVQAALTLMSAAPEYLVQR